MTPSSDSFLLPGEDRRRLSRLQRKNISIDDDDGETGEEEIDTDKGEFEDDEEVEDANLLSWAVEHYGSNCGAIEFTREEDCGAIEFTREDIDVLLTEKITSNNKFSLKTFCCISLLQEMLMREKESWRYARTTISYKRNLKKEGSDKLFFTTSFYQPVFLTAADSSSSPNLIPALHLQHSHLIKVSLSSSMFDQCYSLIIPLGFHQFVV
ncbi:hypothetical protein L1987_45602 [Smallanthus sonchifolius]|uniref:Uncharacterized protein n=1 Tax=Smallanthus sonchifolius TaxID=185202 RepID=A0ACB9FYE5_9ASTR|nr:hypothetical protein L1987_45602 [Smallanthus sonchifolius]